MKYYYNSISKFSTNFLALFKWEKQHSHVFPAVFGICFLMAQSVSGQVSGTVFRDLDNDGVLDATELPEAGIRVVAYNAAGDSVTQVTTTNAAGDNYSFSGLTFPVRLEFRISNYLFASKGAVANTTVQFYVAASSAADLAVQYPVMYCQSNPDVIIPCYVAGDPEGGGTGGSLDALIRFPYTNSGSTPSPVHIASASEIGTVWGSAYQRESKTLILAEFLKRHCGLEALGLGGLFLGDMTTPPGTIASYIDVEDFGINLGSSALAGRTLPSSATSSSADPLAFDNMGKIGMGSIDLSDDGTVLWAVNLFSKEIFSFQIGNPVKAAGSVTAADFESFAIPNPGCTNGVARPWAIEYYEGKVYVGVICSGELAGGTQANMFAYVYRFDPATEIWEGTPVVSFALNYSKGDVHTSFTAVDKWETWANAFTDFHFNGQAGSPLATRTMRPQPILSDIQIDKRGYMILGFCDRTGHQTGRNQVAPTGGSTLYNGYIGGDFLYLKSTGSGTWTLENNGQFTGGPTGSGVGNSQGPGGGEFFGNDYYEGQLVVGGPLVQIHQETMQGGLFYHPGRDEIMTNQMDPLVAFTGGAVRHDADGSSSAAMRYEIYNSTPADGTFGKANGLGLLDMACDALPLEIGNRVWSDADSDGIQDAGENGISGVTVDLYKAGVKVGTTTTDVNGNYFFTASNVNLNGATGLLFNTDYEIRLPIAQAPLTSLELTLTNVNSDLTDNDGTVNGANAVIAYTTEYSGENSHTLDYGFRAPCSITVVSAVPSACNPLADHYSLDVTLNFSNQPAGDLTISTSQGASATFTPNGISFVFTIVGLTADGVQNIDVSAFFVNDPACTNTLTAAYDAPASCACGLSATASGTNALCNGGHDGSATVAHIGNLGAVTYLWSNGETTQSISNLVAGTYTVTVTENATCLTTASYTVTEPSALSATCSSTNVTVPNGSDGAASVSASGGTSNYSYSWSNGGTTASISGLSAGTYTVTVTDANGCTATCSAIVNAASCPVPNCGTATIIKN